MRTDRTNSDNSSLVVRPHTPGPLSGQIRTSVYKTLSGLSGVSGWGAGAGAGS